MAKENGHEAYYENDGKNGIIFLTLLIIIREEIRIIRNAKKKSAI